MVIIIKLNYNFQTFEQTRKKERKSYTVKTIPKRDPLLTINSIPLLMENKNRSVISLIALSFVTDSSVNLESNPNHYPCRLECPDK